MARILDGGVATEGASKAAILRTRELTTEVIWSLSIGHVENKVRVLCDWDDCLLIDVEAHFSFLSTIEARQGRGDSFGKAAVSLSRNPRKSKKRRENRTTTTRTRTRTAVAVRGSTTTNDTTTATKSTTRDSRQ